MIQISKVRLAAPALLVLAPLALVASCQSGDPAPAATTPIPSASQPESTPTPRPTEQEPTAPTPAAPAPTLATASGDDASTLDGVYTSAQAVRGAQVFADICSECHKTEEWSDDAFRTRWQDESVFGFWYYIYEQMPNGAPPYTLTRVQVTDVLTYILELNGLPAGPGELGTDDDSIDQYWLRWMPAN